jgi:DNA-3-methyladenine glycosylase I
VIEEVKVIFFGPSEKLAAFDVNVQEKIKELKEYGVEVLAYKWCSDRIGITAQLEAQGISVVYISPAISNLIKEDWAQLPFLHSKYYNQKISLETRQVLLNLASLCNNGIRKEENTMTECNWPGNDELMKNYHDQEWGKSNHSDRVQFEFLVLEGAQAGLSWTTILHRREGYKNAFYNFDWNKVSRMTEGDVQRLLQDPGIIRNRLKIKSTINNAKRFTEITEEFGSFDSYLWRFTEGRVINNHPKSLTDIPAKSELSDKISKDLKARGFTFIGSTIIYAHLQAVGIVNDHLEGCSHK